MWAFCKCSPLPLSQPAAHPSTPLRTMCHSMQPFASAARPLLCCLPPTRPPEDMSQQSTHLSPSPRQHSPGYPPGRAVHAGRRPAAAPGPAVPAPPGAPRHCCCLLTQRRQAPAAACCSQGLALHCPPHPKKRTTTARRACSIQNALGPGGPCPPPHYPPGLLVWLPRWCLCRAWPATGVPAPGAAPRRPACPGAAGRRPARRAVHPPPPLLLHRC